MKAVVFYEHGGLDRLVYEDFQDPELPADHALIRVKACALNYIDIWGRRGLPTVTIPLPHISGSDISGVVERRGELVTEVKDGEKVLVSPGLSCGRCQVCLTGQDNLCRSYKIIGYQVNGGYAEYVSVPEENLLPFPERYSFEEAAAIPLVFLTAWHMLVARGGVRPKEDILVWAAGSGVGSAAIQIGKLYGARVIATAGSETKLRKARKLGADETINHYDDDVVAQVKRLTNKRGVDIVIDHVGIATWDRSIKSLAPGGRLVTCGATTGYSGETDIRYIYSKQLSILGSYMGSKGELLQVLKFVESGTLKPVVDRTLPLKKAAEAQRAMEKSEHFGKIVLRI